MKRRAFLAGGLAAPAFLRRAVAADAPLPQRLLGRTGLAVSALGFGCTDVRDPAVYRRAVEGYADLGRARRELAAIPAERRVSACGDCPECAVRCPSGVDVRTRALRGLALV